MQALPETRKELLGNAHRRGWWQRWRVWAGREHTSVTQRRCVAPAHHLTARLRRLRGETRRRVGLASCHEGLVTRRTRRRLGRALSRWHTLSLLLAEECSLSADSLLLGLRRLMQLAWGCWRRVLAARMAASLAINVPTTTTAARHRTRQLTVATRSWRREVRHQKRRAARQWPPIGGVSAAVIRERRLREAISVLRMAAGEHRLCRAAAAAISARVACRHRLCRWRRLAGAARMVRELDALGGHAARHLAASCALRAWRAAAARSLARSARLADVRAQVSALWRSKPALRTALGALDGLLTEAPYMYSTDPRFRNWILGQK